MTGEHRATKRLCPCLWYTDVPGCTRGQLITLHPWAVAEESLEPQEQEETVTVPHLTPGWQGAVRWARGARGGHWGSDVWSGRRW